MKKEERVLLHDDDELTDILGMSFASREQLQAWPLSFVERIVLSDGTSRIYKTFYNLPVETEFYRRVRSRHIPTVFYNRSDGDQHWLILEDIAGDPPPAGLSRAQTLELARRGRTIVDGIGSATEARFCLSDKGYDDFVYSTVALLTKLRAEGSL